MTEIRLNDLQLVLLSNAAARDNGSLIPLPESVADQTTRTTKAIELLLKKGLIEEQPGAVRADMWREDGDQAFRLLITDTGRAAINAGDEQPDTKSPVPAPAPNAKPVAAPANKPERNTKRSQLIALLERDGGASLDELVTALSWLPHTTRAAMTGLRKAGMTVDSEKVEGTRRYRITAGA